MCVTVPKNTYDRGVNFGTDFGEFGEIFFLILSDLSIYLRLFFLLYEKYP